MSRAYRIRVRESLKRVLRARDAISTQLELLQILPCDQMAELLLEELLRRGFIAKGKELVRKEHGVTVTVDPEAGTISVQAEAEKQVKITEEKETWGDTDRGRQDKKLKEKLQEDLRRDLEQKAQQQATQLQTQTTAKLEAMLGDLRQELDQAVNRVTAEALKRKAAQMGQIKQVTEDLQTGSLTIVLEV